ncbi:hypothetical protein [Vibrio ezurae]|uniref:Organic solvent tolerance-like N-terminal domain-containing protein n=1 Tax=Vibrio ezurae NBRC 102218 TaxID=1219080 RepID=U3B302_9VIBR|nr:hypothetical protein [Vibrio ezurae]GAD80305.1 hypothetical protein VEZ01S_33_00070 [Vibrio ezurae NBRC 102218]
MNLYKTNIAIALAAVLLSGNALAKDNKHNDPAGDTTTATVKDSFTYDSSKTLKIDDSFKSYNRNELKVNATFVVANSDLNGDVKDNEVELSDASPSPSRSKGKGPSNGTAGALNIRTTNGIDGMHHIAGITTVAQNAGANSLVQQSVNTNASLHGN